MSGRRHALLLALGLFLSLAASAETAPWVTQLSGQELPRPALLEIGVVVFEPGLEQTGAPVAGKDLRSAEARFMPYLLRQVLENRVAWGPVRVLAEPEPSAELLLTGRILESTGHVLALQIEARDSTGRVWIDRSFREQVSLSDYRELPDKEPFLALYERVADSLEAARATLSLTQLEEIILTSELRYAAWLAPDPYENYLGRGEAGRYFPKRLPALDDPFWQRVLRVRRTDRLFVDTVDRHFGRYFDRVAPTYRELRRSNLEADALLAAYRRREAKRERDELRGRYARLRELKLHRQTLRESLSAFAFEVGPTTLELDSELVKLTGSLEAQYRQWRSLLKALYERETGDPAELPYLGGETAGDPGTGDG